MRLPALLGLLSCAVACSGTSSSRASPGDGGGAPATFGASYPPEYRALEGTYSGGYRSAAPWVWTSTKGCKGFVRARARVDMDVRSPIKVHLTNGVFEVSEALTVKIEGTATDGWALNDPACPSAPTMQIVGSASVVAGEHKSPLIFSGRVTATMPETGESREVDVQVGIDAYGFPDEADKRGVATSFVGYFFADPVSEGVEVQPSQDHTAFVRPELFGGP